MSENVVQFPKSKIVREPSPDDDVVKEFKLKGLFNYADGIVDDIVEIMVTEIENHGVDTDSNVFLRDFSMAADALRATIYRQFDLQHNLHNFIDENVTVINRETGKVIKTIKDLDSED
jgi:hypothetical protein